MGMAAGGLVMRPNNECTAMTIGRLLRCELRLISTHFFPSLKPRFDPRNKGDVITAEGEKSFCLMNTDVADDLVLQGDVQLGLRALEFMRPSGPAVFWCIYDSGGSYGFALFNEGKLTRRRCYSVDHGPGESGVPLACEQVWQPAVFSKQEQEENGNDSTGWYRHTVSGALSHSINVMQTLIHEVTIDAFSWSPLDDDLPTEFRYYRMVQDEPVF